MIELYLQAVELLLGKWCSQPTTG